MIGSATQEQRSGHLSGTQKLTCIGVHVDAGLAKPVRPRAFCEYAANTYGFLDTSGIFSSSFCFRMFHVHVMRLVLLVY